MRDRDDASADARLDGQAVARRTSTVVAADAVSIPPR